MTIELGYYTFLSLITFVFAFTNLSIRNSKWLIISLLIIYSIITRFSGFDIDMQVYAKNLSYPLPLLIDFYYYREWFYWFGSVLVYHVVKVEEIVFIIMI